MLPKLFEKFIFEFYKKELSEYSVLFQKQIKWKSDNFDMLPNMSADTIIMKDSKKLIIDTKFYSKTSQSNPFSSNKTVISSNLYQIFAYVKNEAANVPEEIVSGMLLYPQVTEEMKSPAYNMYGNRIFVRTINLNQDFAEIKQELYDIIYDVFDNKANAQGGTLEIGRNDKGEAVLRASAHVCR